MTRSANLVTEWQCFDEAAFHAEWRLERALDDYCDAGGPPPAAAEIAVARRLRFIARHRLRWILHQTRQAQAAASLI